MSPLKIAIIGTGNIARHHLRAYRQLPEKAHVVAVCDVSEPNVRSVAEEFQLEMFYTDPQEMFLDVQVEAVDICTPHRSHAPLSLMASNAGKHVLVEKPMGCSMQECLDMVSAANQSATILMVAQNQRFMHSNQRAQKIIQAGGLGQIRAVRADVMQNLPATLPPPHWLYDGEEAGGGVVISLAVHRIDLLRYLVGEVKQVTAICRTINPAFTHNAEDYAWALLEFENGACGELFATYSGFCLPWGESLMIFGDDGTLQSIPPSGHYSGETKLVSKEDLAASHILPDNPYLGFHSIDHVDSSLLSEDSFINQMNHFIECCQNGTQAISSGRDNLGTMKVVFGIYESAQTGHPVQLRSKEAL